MRLLIAWDAHQQVSHQHASSNILKQEHSTSCCHYPAVNYMIASLPLDLLLQNGGGQVAGHAVDKQIQSEMSEIVRSMTRYAIQ